MKKCPNCGACQECGHAPNPWVRPYPWTQPYYPGTVPHTGPIWISPQHTTWQSPYAMTQADTTSGGYSA